MRREARALFPSECSGFLHRPSSYLWALLSLARAPPHVLVQPPLSGGIQHAVVTIVVIPLGQQVQPPILLLVRLDHPMNDWDLPSLRESNGYMLYKPLTPIPLVHRVCNGNLNICAVAILATFKCTLSITQPGEVILLLEDHMFLP